MGLSLLLGRNRGVLIWQLLLDFSGMKFVAVEYDCFAKTQFQGTSSAVLLQRSSVC